MQDIINLTPLGAHHVDALYPQFSHAGNGADVTSAAVLGLLRTTHWFTKVLRITKLGRRHFKWGKYAKIEHKLDMGASSCRVVGLGGEGSWNWALSIVDEVVEIVALYCICHYFGSGILILPTSAKPDFVLKEKGTQYQGSSNYKCSP